MNNDLDKFCISLVDDINVITKKFEYKNFHLVDRSKEIITRVQNNPNLFANEKDHLKILLEKAMESASVKQWLVLKKPLEDYLAQMTSSQQVAKKDNSSRSYISPLTLVLVDIKSAHNIGSFFRVADCFGVKEIILAGYSSTIENSHIAKSAMNCDQWIPVKRVAIFQDAIKALKNNDYQVIAAETGDKSASINDHNFVEKTAIVFGNERTGLNTFALEQVDQVVSIPMYGKKISLNVSSSASIFCHKYIEQISGGEQ